MKPQWPLIHIDDVNPYKNNPRINDNAVPFTANSIHDFGFQVPIVIGKDNVLVTGHTRILACRELLGSGDLGLWGDAPEGMSEDDPEYDSYQGIAPCIPFVDASSLSEAQINAFRLIDNKTGEYSSWDQEKLEIELAPLEPIMKMERFGFMPIESIEVYDGEDNSVELPDIGGMSNDALEGRILVTTDTVFDAEDLVKRLSEEGYRCKLL